MQIAIVAPSSRGQTDKVLSDVAATLVSEGVRVAGVVQTNVERPGRNHCDMDLQVLSSDKVVRINQDLGEGAKGCRLDPGALEAAVAGVEATFSAPIDLLIVNKFGQREVEGGGFRNLIAEALARDVPVLLGVSNLNRPALEDFTAGLATPLAAETGAILRWCHASLLSDAPRELTAPETG